MMVASKSTNRVFSERLTTRGYGYIGHVVLAVFVLFSLYGGTVRADDAPRTLIVTGAAPYGYHPWKSNMKVIEKRLRAFGMDNYDKLIAKGLEDWRKWDGNVDDYDAVVLIYYWSQAPGRKLRALDQYLREGGGLVVVHSALAGFWKQDRFDHWVGMAYRERDAEYGYSVVFSEAGKRIVRDPGEGGGSGHAPIRPFRIHTRDTGHPITQGLPETWMQAEDELYYNLRGPNPDVRVLATARTSDGKYHPQAWVRAHGKGRVFCLTPGHHRPGASSVGFVTFLARGIEWAATGRVTLPVPANFPDETEPKTEVPRFER